METPQERSYGLIPIRLLSASSSEPPTSHNTEILLIHQRSTMPSHPLFWTFPKGHAEAGDADILDTARRELKEETSISIDREDVLFKIRDEAILINAEEWAIRSRQTLDVKAHDGVEEGEKGGDGAWVETYINPAKGWVKEVRYWIGIVPFDSGNVQIQEQEIAEARWMGWDEAESLFTFEEGRIILRDVRKTLDSIKES